MLNVAFYVFYMLFAFAKANLPHTTPQFPVSVIICAKNEAQNLQHNIPKILSQNYPNFEVILINDASSDESGEIIEGFALENENVQQVHVVNNEAFWGNKKYALTLGIKKATHNHLLFTDADCVPGSNLWLSEMASAFVDKKQIVLGYGAYEKIKGSWLNKLIRFETLLTALQYFSWALAGKPYMGVGRNLAYTSELFYDQKGFIKHIKIQSGDDDLFVNEASTKMNTAINYRPDSFTISTPKKTVKSWIIQKRRHLSTAIHYKRSHQFFLGLFYLSQLVFILLLPIVIASLFLWKIVIAVVVARYVISWLVVGNTAFKLQERDLIILYPIHEALLIFVQLSIFISKQFSKTTRWK